MTPEEIGLVEMTCEAILEGDDPELEEMDDPTRIPPGAEYRKEVRAIGLF